MDDASAPRSLRVLAVLVIFTLAAGELWRNLLGWWGWGAVVGLLLAAVIVSLVRARVSWRRLPPTLLLFLLLATISIAWSAYPGASLLGTVATWATALAGVFLATRLPWGELVDALGVALRWVLGLSLAFELVVSLVVRAPVLPLWVDYSDLETIPRAFYWSRDLLLEGGRIQGVVGNANLLAMVALLSLIVSLACLLGRRGSPAWNAAWALVAVGVLALTRSSTVIVAGVVTLLVVGVVLLIQRGTGWRRRAVQIASAVLAVAAVVVLIVWRDGILSLLGRSPDLTNRVGIWETIGALALERPVAGWGWVSYWFPWVEPFDDLIVINGVTYLQAHNAWLDVAFQLGALGLVVFAGFALWTLLRSWLTAIEPSGRVVGSLLPLALLVALLVQSLAESRLLVELGFALLVVLAIRSATPPGDDASLPEPTGARAP